MKKFGAYGFSKSANGPVKLRQFLIENTVRFGEWYGLSAKDIAVRTEYALDGSGILVGTHKEPLVDKRGRSLLADREMVIAYDYRSFSRLLDGWEGDVKRYMWTILGRALRAWVIAYEDVNLDDLLPCCLLRDFGMGSSSESLCQLYVERCWTSEQAKRNFDVTFVSLYLAELVALRAEEDRMSLEEVGNLMFRLRKSNWAKFLANLG